MSLDVIIITVIALAIVIGSCVALAKAGRKAEKQD